MKNQILEKPYASLLSERRSELPLDKAYGCHVARGSKDITLCQSLLYKVYIEAMGWQIPSPNPSNLTISHQNNESILVDDYDEFAKWFLVKDKTLSPITTARLCTEDKNGRLEIERYPNARNALKHILARKRQHKIIELNREALLPTFSNNKKPCFILLKTIFEYCCKQGFSILSTTNLEEWLAIYDEINWKKLNNFSFKYNDRDDNSVSVFFATPLQLDALVCTLDNKLSLYNMFELV